MVRVATAGDRPGPAVAGEGRVGDELVAGSQPPLGREPGRRTHRRVPAAPSRRRRCQGGRRDVDRERTSARRPAPCGRRRATPPRPGAPRRERPPKLCRVSPREIRRGGRAVLPVHVRSTGGSLRPRCDGSAASPVTEARCARKRPTPAVPSYRFGSRDRYNVGQGCLVSMRTDPAAPVVVPDRVRHDAPADRVGRREERVVRGHVGRRATAQDTERPSALRPRRSVPQPARVGRAYARNRATCARTIPSASTAQRRTPKLSPSPASSARPNPGANSRVKAGTCGLRCGLSAPATSLERLRQRLEGVAP